MPSTHLRSGRWGYAAATIDLSGGLSLDCHNSHVVSLGSFAAWWRNVLAAHRRSTSFVDLTERAAGRYRLRCVREKVSRGLSGAAAFLLVLIVLAIPFFIVSELWSRTESMAAEIVHVGVLLLGTLKATLAAMLVAVPLAVGAAVYVAMYLSDVWRERLRAGMEMLEALPSVVIGLLAAVWLAPLLKMSGVLLLISVLSAVFLICLLACMPFQRHLTWRPVAIWLTPLGLLGLVGALSSFTVPAAWQPANPWNAVLVGVAMGLANVPLLFNLVESALRDASNRYARSALTLGAQPAQVLSTLLFPVAKPALLGAICTVAARCNGETMIVLMASANTALISMNPFDGLRSLAADLALSLPFAELSSPLYTRLLIAALLLFAMSVLLDWLARRLVQSRNTAGYSR